MSENEHLELEQDKNEDGGAEPKEEKPTLTPEQIRGIKQRQFTKLAKELGIDTKPEEKKEEDGRLVTLAENSYLRSSGIQTDEFDFVRKSAKEAGKSIEDIIETKWFQAELKEHREERETKEALPAGSKRSAGAPRDSVDYHVSRKTPLTEIDDRDLRKKVRIAREGLSAGGSKFTDHPIGNL